MIHINILVFTFICFPMLVFAGPASEAVKVIEQKHIHRQKCKYGFQCSSLGGGGDGKRFKHLKIGFNTKEQLTVHSARKYMVESILSYMHDINCNINLREHFTEWPFRSDKLTYTIRVSGENGLWPSFPNGLTPDKRISYACFSYCEIDYYIDINPKKRPVAIHTETLDEAIAILKAEGWTEPVDYNSHVN